MTRTKKGTFAAGNPGRPAGARNRTTQAIEALLDGEAEKLTRKCITAAKGGDMTAMRLCMERLAPVRKGKPVPFAMPTIDTVADIPKAGKAILAAVAAGDLSPEEAHAVMSVVEGFRRAVETSELAARLEALENTIGDGSR